MQNILILYFSGTGNTEFVAKCLQEEFISVGNPVDIVLINEKLDKQTINIEQYDLIGIGYPVHAFNAPEYVRKFISEMLPIIKGEIGEIKKTFIFKVPGDAICHGGATTAVRKRLKMKGYNVFYEGIFVMPANVFVNFADSLKKQLHLIAKKQSKIVVREVLDGKVQLQRNTWFLRMFSYLFSTGESRGARKFGKYNKISEDCNLCQICVKNCPTNNISIIENAITFADNCTFCMKCIYNCPQNAIYNKFFKVFVLEDGYSKAQNQKLLSDESIKKDFLTKETKGFYKHYYKYFKKKGLLPLFL